MDNTLRFFIRDLRDIFKRRLLHSTVLDIDSHEIQIKDLVKRTIENYPGYSKLEDKIFDLNRQISNQDTEYGIIEKERDELLDLKEDHLKRIQYLENVLDNKEIKYDLIRGLWNNK